MLPPPADYYRVAPELVLCGFGILVMVADPFLAHARKGALAWLALLGAVAGLAALEWPARLPGTAFYGLFLADRFSLFLHVLVVGVAILAILGSYDYLRREDLQSGEYYALILFATAGMGVMAGAGELMTAFLGLEMSSISSYILAGYRRGARKSSEASLKYFLLGSFATAFFLYGVAMVYGATGTTFVVKLQGLLAQPGGAGELVILGLALLFVGLAFKVVAAPFQIYTPDVYEGAPTPVTALLSSGPKAAAFALLARVLFTAFGSASHTWFWAIWISAVATMFVGNLAALVQTNLKRMLAYSSIAHAGYILVAFAAIADFPLAAAAALYYLAAYALMKLGAFIFVAHFGGAGERRLEIANYAGLGAQQPLPAACFSLYLLSLLGMPVTAGFLAKFYVFQAALDSKLVGLAILLAINSVIGAYYYLRVIVAMYFREPQQEFAPMRMTPAVGLVLLITAAGTIYLGLFPSQVMRFAQLAAQALR
jgi:NADH-quinone oxidoreductase subunit N